MADFQESDKFDLWRVKSFFDLLDRETRKLGQFELSGFDSIASDCFCFLLNECARNNNKSVQVSSYALSRVTHSTRKRVRTRLDVMARYGLLRIKTEWRNDGSNKRKPMTLTPNPWLFPLLSVGAKVSHKFQAAKHFSKIGVDRLEYEEAVQGFKSDTPLGTDEPEGIQDDTPEETGEKINELIEKEEKRKAEKLKEQEEWRKLGNAFVDQAATMWKKGQEALGHGSADPVWSGDPNRLAPSARKERLELTKIFEQWGGKPTILAWYIFTCGLPEVDRNTGKRTFNLNKPHTQFASIDRRPSTFAKYFNSILMDPTFIQYSKKDWGQFYPHAEKLFPGTFDKPARDGKTEYEKLGYKFGDTSPSLQEVRA